MFGETVRLAKYLQHIDRTVTRNLTMTIRQRCDAIVQYVYLIGMFENDFGWTCGFSRRSVARVS